MRSTGPPPFRISRRRHSPRVAGRVGATAVAAIKAPEDAFRCFMGTGIEVLVVGNCVLRKEVQNPSLRIDYKEAFELD